MTQPPIIARRQHEPDFDTRAWESAQPWTTQSSAKRSTARCRYSLHRGTGWPPQIGARAATGGGSCRRRRRSPGSCWSPHPRVGDTRRRPVPGRRGGPPVRLPRSGQRTGHRQARGRVRARWDPAIGPLGPDRDGNAGGRAGGALLGTSGTPRPDDDLEDDYDCADSLRQVRSQPMPNDRQPRSGNPAASATRADATLAGSC